MSGTRIDRMRILRASRLVALLLLVMARSVAAAKIYECRDGAGHVAYQDHACAPSDREATIAIATPAAPITSAGEPRRDVARPHAKAAAAPRRSSRRRAARERAAVSYECRADDGAVFYRHGTCPRSIRSAAAASIGRASRSAAARSAAVSAVPLPRGEACRRIAAAGSIGRAGREHDARVSTYERNAGRDPCRYD